MSSKIPKTLYHYCSLDTFLNIIRNSSIWLSDVKKSNDSKEMAWFRQQYYEFIFKKYSETNDEEIKKFCEIIFSIASKDGFNKCPPWLLLGSETGQKLVDIFGGLRTYAFCLSELSDSLGQWRGYANDGKGIAIGFSRNYLSKISGYSLRCPTFNFFFANVSYRENFDSLFEMMIARHDKSQTSEFVLNAMLDLTHASALFKHPSFKEEKEWRITYSMEDYWLTEDILTFKNFDAISSKEYKNNFGIPKIDYIAKETDIIPHIEIKLNDISKAINSIVIGPKSNITDKDIRHILLRFGILKTHDDNSIKIFRSESSYR